MGNRKYLYLDQLVVWSDNPRHGPLETENISEVEAINILIDVVGTDKMYNLIADIFAFKGLLGNVNPVVVQNEEKFLVYDGNRRVSALKILDNPSIVENYELQQKVYTLIENEEISFINKVFVYITDEDEALEIMDKTHSGEQQGIGMISWEPYQRDISLYRHGKSLKYPFAYSVAIALGYNIKSFDAIPYTDLDRLFGSTVLRNHFKLSESTSEFPTRAEYIVGMLIKYKSKKKFRSYSRYFNKTDSESDGPMKEFCEWVMEQEKKKRNFYFKSQPIELFIDESFTLEMLHLEIFDSNQKVIQYSPTELKIKYITPNGISAETLSMSETGVWEVQIEFKGELHSEKVTIYELLSPKIDFNSSVFFGKGNTIDLRKLMIRATNGHGKDVSSSVEIKADEYVDIVGDVFTTNNSIDTYQIEYSFIDITGAPFSRTKEITITDKNNPLLAENRDTPLLSYNGSCRLINISEVVNKLINEINSLDFDDNVCILTTSLRTLLELSFDEIQIKKKIPFSKGADFQQRIDEFKAEMLPNRLSDLCNRFPVDLPSYNTEKNNIILINPVELSSLLNLAAHKSVKRIDVTKIAELARKIIAPILVYISLLLK